MAAGSCALSPRTSSAALGVEPQSAIKNRWQKAKTLALASGEQRAATLDDFRKALRPHDRSSRRSSSQVLTFGLRSRPAPRSSVTCGGLAIPFPQSKQDQVLPSTCKVMMRRCFREMRGRMKGLMRDDPNPAAADKLRRAFRATHASVRSIMRLHQIIEVFKEEAAEGKRKRGGIGKHDLAFQVKVSVETAQAEIKWEEVKDWVNALHEKVNACDELSSEAMMDEVLESLTEHPESYEMAKGIFALCADLRMDLGEILRGYSLQLETMKRMKGDIDDNIASANTIVARLLGELVRLDEGFRGARSMHTQEGPSAAEDPTSEIIKHDRVAVAVDRIAAIISDIGTTLCSSPKLPARRSPPNKPSDLPPIEPADLPPAERGDLPPINPTDLSPTDPNASDIITKPPFLGCEVVLVAPAGRRTPSSIGACNTEDKPIRDQAFGLTIDDVETWVHPNRASSLAERRGMQPLFEVCSDVDRVVAEALPPVGQLQETSSLPQRRGMQPLSEVCSDIDSSPTPSRSPSAGRSLPALQTARRSLPLRMPSNSSILGQSRDNSTTGSSYSATPNGGFFFSIDTDNDFEQAASSGIQERWKRTRRSSRTQRIPHRVQPLQ